MPFQHDTGDHVPLTSTWCDSSKTRGVEFQVSLPGDRTRSSYDTTVCAMHIELMGIQIVPSRWPQMSGAPICELILFVSHQTGELTLTLKKKFSECATF